MKSRDIILIGGFGSARCVELLMLALGSERIVEPSISESRFPLDETMARIRYDDNRLNYQKMTKPYGHNR